MDGSSCLNMFCLFLNVFVCKISSTFVKDEKIKNCSIYDGGY